MDNKFVIGLDFGSDSVRAVIVDCANGNEISQSVSYYQRWGKGLYCNPSQNIFRQHPQDYIESMTQVIKESLKLAPEASKNNIVGLSVDTTGSTPIAVDQSGTPLALLPQFKENPNAMFILWKDHSSLIEADEINHHCRNWGGTDYSRFSGGIYSSEWFWAKILRTLRIDEEVRNASHSWVEHCDWIPALLCGKTDPAILKRSRCAAGHKALWHESWSGLPSEEFLTSLDPLLSGLRERLNMNETYPSDVCVGSLSPEWAEKLGLSTEVKIGVGAFDCHMGAVGALVKPGVLTKVVGTSTCDIAIASSEEIGDRLIPGICGQVLGSVTPQHVGLEAGQSAFGDLYAWFKELITWPLYNCKETLAQLPEETKQNLIEGFESEVLKKLGEAAQTIKPGVSSISALDWINGRRTPDANQHLKMALSGLSMGSDAPALFRALVEATAYGSNAIIKRLEEQGIPVEKVVAIGGIPKKSSFIMQVCADIWQKDIDVVSSDQCCALGAAMFAATIAGVYPNIDNAQEAMAPHISQTYRPNPDNAIIYEKCYQNYLELGNIIEKQTLEKSSQ